MYVLCMLLEIFIHSICSSLLQPLTGMPTLTREPEQSNSDEDEEDDDYSRPKFTSRPSSKG